MPEIKLQHVVSSSSEDKNNPATNLLKPDGAHKWKSASCGEKQVTAVLQFEKSSQVQSIDIGNEGSGFIEVLVGKSTAVSDQDYQVILVASTFMTPLESRNGANRNAVRMFGPDKLSKAVSGQNWDRVKIVCTQPFNKNTPYGISFINFHSPSDGTEEPVKTVKKFGAFTIRPSEDDNIRAGSIFADRSRTDSSTPLKGPAAIRAASKLVEDTKSPSSLERKPAAPSTPAAKTSSSSSSSSKPVSSQSTPKPKTSTTPKRKHSVSDDEEKSEIKTPLRKQSTSLSSTMSSYSNKSNDKAPPLKRVKSEPAKASPAKEFSRLMEKVVFVMSGYQNPYRGELRDKAVEMGAIYKPDWGRKCTHLICAFPHTPKYNQVKGKGRIVEKNWITDCYKQKKLLSWRKYRVGNAESPDESSEEEEEEIKTPVSKKHTSSSVTSSSGKKTLSKAEYEKKYGGNTDSNDDTDDEIERARVKIKQNKAKVESEKKIEAVKQDDDEYGGSTDEDSPMKKPVTKTIKTEEPDSPMKKPVIKTIKTEEPDSPMKKPVIKTFKTEEPMKTEDTEYDSSDSGLPELPDFFTDRVFFLYGDFSEVDRRLMTRYITAYNGELSEYMNEHVTYILTNSKWDDNFDDALSENEKLVFVKPKWIHLCHEKLKCVPHQPYVVVPI